MIETFSGSLFLSSASGKVLGFIGFAALYVGLLAALLWLLFRVRQVRREGGWARLVPPTSLVLVVAGSGILYHVQLSSLPHGEIETVQLQHVGDETLLQVGVSWRSGGRGARREHSALKAFTLDGKLLGSRRTTDEFGRAGPARVGHLEGADVLHGKDTLLLVDPVTHATVVDVQSALDGAYGKQSWRIEHVNPPHVDVELRDGSIEHFDLTPLASGHGLRQATDGTVLVGSDACWVANAGQEESDEAIAHESSGLLQARVLQRPRRTKWGEPCDVDMGRPAWLVLHRSAAFGDDAAHLLSAIPIEGAQSPIWTVDLQPALGRHGTEHYELYSPERRGTDLCMWLVRGKRSLSELCLDVQSGRILSARVVF